MMMFSLMVSVYYFYILKRTLTLEAVNLCFSDTYSPVKPSVMGLETNPNSQQELGSNEDYELELRKEIETVGFSKLESSEFQKKCIFYVFLRIRKFKHAKGLRCLLGDRKCENQKEVELTLRKFDCAITCFCMFLPMIYLALEIMRSNGWENQPAILMLNICKCICMVNFNYEVWHLLRNLKAFLKKTSLSGKFNCLKTMIILFVSQNVIMNFIEENEELGLSLNFVILAGENLALGYFWIKYYGVKGSEVSRLNGLRFEGKFEDRIEKEAHLLVENQNEEAANL